MHNTDSLPAHTDKFLRCLRAEEELLASALKGANEVHAALRAGDLATATETAARQQDLAVALYDASTARTGAVAALAVLLRLHTDDLTLSILAAHLPAPFDAEVRATRERLTAVTAELAAIQTRNANLLGHLRSFFRGVLSDLTVVDAPVRYGPSGTRLNPLSGAALKARG